jgi:hypothetical protein
MRTSTKIGLALLSFPVFYVLLGMYGNAPRAPQSGTTLSNVSVLPNQSLSNPVPANAPDAFPQGPILNLPAPVAQEGMKAGAQGGMQKGMQNGIQVIRSLLGLEVTFLKGNINYPGPQIVNDIRYQALTGNERLVDSIKFQPPRAPLFLILIAIGKTPNGTPAIVPGKFDIVRKTDQEGFVLTDSNRRIFYYSGYILETPAWKNVGPGQTLVDKFCKQPVPMNACAPQNVVTVNLKKNSDPKKDIPILALIGKPSSFAP